VVRPALAFAALVLALALVPDPARADPAGAAVRIVARAREEVRRSVRYDGDYRAIAYPGGDVDPATGVCTDVVIRALRAAGTDLQRLVHEDVARAPFAYPHIGHADASIDHRRVPGLLAYFRRHATRLPIGTRTAADRATWSPGDVVVWQFGGCPACRPRHVGVVTDRVGPSGLPMVVHNVSRAAEEDVLEAWVIVGHFRVAESAAP